jgi:oxygen-dependent protoporphyrinogen oxidase
MQTGMDGRIISLFIASDVIEERGEPGTYTHPATMSPPRHITVLGGGLTGLTTAYRLAVLLRASSGSGSPSAPGITLIEAQPRLGGWVDSRTVSIPGHGDVVLESGPRSVRPRGGVGAARLLHLVGPAPP